MVKYFVLLILFSMLSACQTLSTSDEQEIHLGNTLKEDEKIARTAYDAKDYVTAERAYRRLTVDMPTDEFSWYRLGNIYARTNQPEKAQNAYQEALLRKPDNVKTWHNMGIIQLRKALLSFVEVQKNSEPGSDMYNHATKVLILFDHVIETGNK